jgi:hypothetical protein
MREQSKKEKRKLAAERRWEAVAREVKRFREEYTGHGGIFISSSSQVELSLKLLALIRTSICEPLLMMILSVAVHN